MSSLVRTRTAVRSGRPTRITPGPALGRHQETLLTSLPADALPQRFDQSGMAWSWPMAWAARAPAKLRAALREHARQPGCLFGRWNVRIDEPIASEVIDRIERFYRGVDATLRERARPCTP